LIDAYIDPLYLRMIHILSATVLFGTGMGTAFHGLASNLSGDVRAIAVANRNVVLADWLFTTPAVIVQPVTGLLLAWDRWPLTSGWLMLTMVLYVFIGACWLPVVWLQIEMKKIADKCVAEGTPLPPLYHRYFRWWFILGWPAFIALIGVVWLMVFKPAF
jgi:uncharacterized membrane protein